MRNQHARLRLPELQPAAAHQRAGERRAAAGLRRRRRARARGARRARSSASASATPATTTRRSSPAGSSSGSRSRARSSTSRRSCFADEPTGNLDSKTSDERDGALPGALARGAHHRLRDPRARRRALRIARASSLRDGQIVSDTRQEPRCSEPAPTTASAAA